MEVRFRDYDIGRLEREPRFTAGFPPEIVRMIRRRLEQIRQAPDEQDFRSMRSFHFEKLRGTRKGQHLIGLNDQWRIVFELKGKGSAKVVYVLAVEDYHQEREN